MSVAVSTDHSSKERASAWTDARWTSKESKILHTGIHEYLEWYFDQQRHHHGKIRNQGSKRELPRSSGAHTPDEKALMHAFRKVFPHVQLSSKRQKTKPLQRPWLVSAVFEYRSKQEESSTSPTECPIWEDYYEALKWCLQSKRSFPPDTMHPRGFLSWCVHQRWAYKEYHQAEEATEAQENVTKQAGADASSKHVRSTESQEKSSRPCDDKPTGSAPTDADDSRIPVETKETAFPEDDSSDKKQPSPSSAATSLSSAAALYSHLTPERMDKLSKLGFQWIVVPDQENPTLAKSIRVQRKRCLDPDDDEENENWKRNCKTFQSLLVKDDDAKTENTNDDEPSSATAQDDVAAKKWLQDQIRRYREWDAGFVDFPKPQRDALHKQGLLPDLVPRTDSHWFFDVNAEEDENGEGTSSEEEDDEDEDEDKSAQPLRRDLMEAIVGKASSPRKSLKRPMVPTKSPPPKKKKAKVDDPWEKRYLELVAFHKKYGHAHVKGSMDASLYSWTKKQRYKYRSNESAYPKDRKEKLDRLGFAWDSNQENTQSPTLNGTHLAALEKAWFEKLEDLKRYKERFGSFSVPRKWPEDQSLSHWVKHQREYLRKDLKGQITFPESRRKALEEIGFGVSAEPDTPKKSSTRQRSDASEDAKGKGPETGAASDDDETEGEVCLTTASSSGSSTKRQRPEHTQGAASPSSTNSVSLENAWFEKLVDLKRYKERFGNFNVPRKWPEDQSLSNWVKHQREYLRKDLKGRITFPESRRKALEEIGFGVSAEPDTPKKSSTRISSGSAKDSKGAGPKSIASSDDDETEGEAVSTTLLPHGSSTKRPRVASLVEAVEVACTEAFKTSKASGASEAPTNSNDSDIDMETDGGEVTSVPSRSSSNSHLKSRSMQQSPSTLIESEPPAEEGTTEMSCNEQCFIGIHL